MDRRTISVGLLALVIGVLMSAGSASAHKAHHKRHKTVAAPAHEPCLVTTEPGSFVDTGEFGEASSVATFIGVECEPVYAEKSVTLSATELYERCAEQLQWGFPAVKGSSFTVKLDNDGNGGTIVFGGPSCAAGESLVTAELDTPPYTTVTTAFTVLPPEPTTAPLKAEPPTSIASEETSEVGTVVEVEFPPVYAEQLVNINARELFNRCQGLPKLVWIGPDAKVLAEDTPEVSKVKLDNDGNAFVVLLGVNSCAAGPSLIEASLENAPYTTYTTIFTVVPPIPTI